jgi:uncharacterized protein
MKILLIFLATLLPLSAQTGEKLLAAARQQIGVTVRYDPSYTALDFPNGDVPTDRGVCTDVVIRAMRTGLTSDLQQLINQDMRANFSIYPKIWSLSKPDRNIDHRRVPNLQTYFKRQGYELALAKEKDPTKFLPGDIITCLVPPRLPHIMIVSDKKSASGVPCIIHNIGSGTLEENRLFQFEITGHYRIK